MKKLKCILKLLLWLPLVIYLTSLMANDDSEINNQNEQKGATTNVFKEFKDVASDFGELQDFDTVKQAADSGDSDSQFLLGLYYDKDNFFEENKEVKAQLENFIDGLKPFHKNERLDSTKSFKYYKLAADQDHHHA